ncbi:phage tail assembly protein T, partial [Escherichia coli]|nr:phage tail assembly protein T [Escherichia coli]
QNNQLAMRFLCLTYAVLILFFCDPVMHPSDFSLIVPRHEQPQVEIPDDDKMLMQKAAGLAGGVRFGGDGGRDILSSADVADVMVDDAAFKMASAGISGGVRYVPAGW